jgi:cyclic-di-AMP phosphodiesterase PgpH
MLLYGLLKEISNPWWFVVNMSTGLVTGILSAMTVLAIIPYLEALFKITTPQTLLELANLNHPLLKRLMMSAPGTYQHSLMVANLAEAAAESIHANPVLCRVGAYYHDIGKIKRPHFFTENQFSGKNPHTSLTPRMSKMIIIAHIRDGLELAQKYKLPGIIKDFIAEHHGTTLASFFYEKALQSGDISDPESEKQNFRYPGPKPHMKESGIVMFADSVEAAVRSMENPTLPKIESIIEKIFHDKIEDHQMDDCPLSLREIDTIKATFLRVFHGIYHTRLNYQEEIDAIIQQTKTKK